MRDGRVVVSIRVLVDVEGVLHFEILVCEKSPVGARRDAQLVRVVQIVRHDSNHLRERHRAPLEEPQHLALVHPFARAVLSPAQHEHHHVIALKLRQTAHCAGVIAQLKSGSVPPGSKALAHGLPFRQAGRMPGMLKSDAINGS